MTATTKITVMTVDTPYISAILPKTGAKTQPALTDKPRVTPDARPTLFGRYCCPSTTSELYGIKIKNPAAIIISAESANDSVTERMNRTGTTPIKL